MHTGDLQLLDLMIVIMTEDLSSKKVLFFVRVQVKGQSKIFSPGYKAHKNNIHHTILKSQMLHPPVHGLVQLSVRRRDQQHFLP